MDGLTPTQLAEVARGPDVCPKPLSAQQAANAERLAWSKECATDQQYLEPDWRDGAGAEPPPELLPLAFIAALANVPLWHWAWMG